MVQFDLPTPIPYFNVTLTKGAWKLFYPDLTMYYVLKSEADAILKEGNWVVPQEVADQWLDDQVVTDALVAAKPWEIPQAAE